MTSVNSDALCALFSQTSRSVVEHTLGLFNHLTRFWAFSSEKHLFILSKSEEERNCLVQKSRH